MQMENFNDVDEENKSKSSLYTKVAMIISAIFFIGLIVIFMMKFQTEVSNPIAITTTIEVQGQTPSGQFHKPVPQSDDGEEKISDNEGDENEEADAQSIVDEGEGEDFNAGIEPDSSVILSDEEKDGASIVNTSDLDGEDVEKDEENEESEVEEFEVENEDEEVEDGDRNDEGGEDKNKVFEYEDESEDRHKSSNDKESLLVEEVPDDIFSIYLNDELFSMILEYLAESPGKMAMASKKLGSFVQDAAPGESYGILQIELEMITKLRNLADVELFNQRLFDLFINENAFDELAQPVFSYLVKSLCTKLERGTAVEASEKESLSRYAAGHGLYELYFEIKKYSQHFICPFTLFIDDSSFYFDFFDWVYESSRARGFFLKRLAATAGRYKMSDADMQFWTAVCIQRQASETFYIGYLISRPRLFIDTLRLYLCQCSLISLDSAESGYYHAVVDSLLGRYLRPNRKLAELLPFIELLNDVRYGPHVDAEYYQDRVTAAITGDDEYDISMLVMAASKANKKDLVKVLSKHPNFDIYKLNELVKYKNPHDFKAFFDIIESDHPLYDGVSEWPMYKLIETIVANKFKISSVTVLPAGFKFEIQSALEYVELGFAPTYELVLEPEWALSRLRDKMLNDAAEGGYEGFEHFVNEYFGCDSTSNFFHGSTVSVSVKVVQFLLEDEELDDMITGCDVALRYEDQRCNKLIEAYTEAYTEANTSADTSVNASADTNE